MTDDYSHQLNNAREAIASGDKRTAQQILADILNHDTQNVDAWLLLADILDNPHQRIESLKRVLQINPNNIIAKRRLQEISIQERNEVPIAQISQPKPSASPSTQILQPKVTTSPRKQNKSSVWVYVLIMVVCCLAVGFVFLVASTNLLGGSNGNDHGSPPAGPMLMCEKFVTNKLMSPSTAKFPDISDQTITNLAQTDSYRVTGYVDAQNGFGAMIRNYYTCDVQYTGSSNGQDNFILLNLDMHP